MGEDAHFFDFEGAASPGIVRGLRNIPKHTPLEDPDLLARLIDGYAGFDFEANLVGLEAERRELRSKLRPMMEQIQQLAVNVLREMTKGRDVGAAELAIADLLDGAAWRHLKCASDPTTPTSKVRHS